MTHASFVLTAWGATLAGLGTYVCVLIVRGRRLVRRARDHEA